MSRAIKSFLCPRSSVSNKQTSRKQLGIFIRNKHSRAGSINLGL